MRPSLYPIFHKSDGTLPVQFVSTWDTEKTDATASPSQNIVLPMTAGPLVDWGDGTVNNLNSHVYASGGLKTITIDNTNSDFRFANAGDKIKIIDVSQSNGLNVTNNQMFQRCKDMTWTATDNPNITSTNLGNMFEGCEVLNGTSNFAGWDVSNVTQMPNMFFGCFDFTGGGIENWDVGNCQNFNQMFFAAHVLAAPLGVWDMSSATNIAGMFRASNGFNQPLNGWGSKTQNIQQMNHVFAGCPYTQDLDQWDVSSVTLTHAMFSGNNYNGDITTWVFGSNYADSSWMFASNPTFNRDISGWNVANVTNMSNMFGSASSFDQDLTGWNIGSVTNMATMLNNSGLSQANYDAFLINCDGQSVQPNVTLGAQNLQYTAAGAGGTARTNLAGAPDLWTFVGDIAN